MDFKLNTQKIQILTDSGFRTFSGIALTNIQTNTIRFTFNDQSTICVTEKHKFVVKLPPIRKGFDEEAVTVHALSLNIGDQICSMDDYLTITDIEYNIPNKTYELIDVGSHRYKTNSVISHNCEFLTSDPTLLDPIILGSLESQVQPHIMEDMGFKFWQPLRPRRQYILGIDPATGSLEDFTVMTLIDFTTLSIVAIFRSNTMSSPQAYASLKLLLNKLDQIDSTCYFSIENNGVGEGIISLYENDEHIPQTAEFISEEGAKRYGMYTENRVKLRACLVLKQLIESGKFKISSEDLLKELRSYVTHKGSYAAQYGATDDIISSMLIVVRILEEMSTYDTKAFDVVNDYNEIGSFAVETTDESDYDDNYIPDGFLI